MLETDAEHVESSVAIEQLMGFPSVGGRENLWSEPRLDPKAEGARDPSERATQPVLASALSWSICFLSFLRAWLVPDEGHQRGAVFLGHAGLCPLLVTGCHVLFEMEHDSVGIHQRQLSIGSGPNEGPRVPCCPSPLPLGTTGSGTLLADGDTSPSPPHNNACSNKTPRRQVHTTGKQERMDSSNRSSDTMQV